MDKIFCIQLNKLIVRVLVQHIEKQQQNRDQNVWLGFLSPRGPRNHRKEGEKVPPPRPN